MPPSAEPEISDALAEELGQQVRREWETWAATQDDVDEHPGWTEPWYLLEERLRDVDRIIGRALYIRGYAAGQATPRPAAGPTGEEAREALAGHDAGCAACRDARWLTDRCEDGLVLANTMYGART